MGLSNKKYVKSFTFYWMSGGVGARARRRWGYPDSIRAHRGGELLARTCNGSS
jgi:hypothetical protein